MVVKHFKLADGASFIARFVKVLVDAILHKEVLEIARQNNYIIVHLGWLLTQLAFNGAQSFLVKVVQTEQIKSLQLYHVISHCHHREFGLSVQTTSNLHKDFSLQLFGLSWQNKEKVNG